MKLSLVMSAAAVYVRMPGCLAFLSSNFPWYLFRGVTRMKSRSSKASCLLSNALVVGSILVFAVGFFPHKAFLPGLATWSDRQDGSIISAPFDKVIFMVVDALRRQDIRPLRIGFTTTDSAQWLRIWSDVKFQLYPEVLESCESSSNYTDTRQPHTIWSSNTVYRPCQCSYDYHASGESYYYWLGP